MCLDVTDTFIEHARAGEQLYWSDDVHLNAAGNKVLADIVWSYLVEMKLATNP